MLDDRKNILDKKNNKWFGHNTENFLKHLSKTAVEEHSENSVLFFVVDYEKSKRNFYGEFEYLYFTNTKGIELKGIVTINNEDVDSKNNVYDQNTNMIFSVYISHLKEKGVNLEIGDYLSYRNKFYKIYNKIALDSNKNIILYNDEPMWNSYMCYQEQDEVLRDLINNFFQGSKKDIY